jgi:hypothetical protein
VLTKDKPFRARSMDLCLVGRYPFLPNGDISPLLGPERDREANVPTLSRARPRSFDVYLHMNCLVSFTCRERGIPSEGPPVCGRLEGDRASSFGEWLKAVRTLKNSNFAVHSDAILVLE